MTTKLKSLALFTSFLLIATIAIADEPVVDPPTQGVKTRVAEQLLKTHTMRRKAATNEYAVRIAEYKAGRSSVNVVLQANQRFLDASLASNSPNAAVDYDRRAAEIELFAQKNLELGTGTVQEVAQAKSARLDALLKNLLARPGSSNN